MAAGAQNLGSLSGPLAIVAGAGALPRLLAEACDATAQPYTVVQFPGTRLDWAQGKDVIHAEFERPGAMFRAMHARGCRFAVLGGAMVRPHLRPWRFDWTFLRIATKLLRANRDGDDTTLRRVIRMFEDDGFEVLAAHELREDLLARQGVLTKTTPSRQDAEDADRAARIVAALGSVDVGQGAVVAQGVCLAVESIQGTDRMLDFVAATDPATRPNPKKGRGVLLKAPKPGQDLRVDLPAIGPDTVDGAARAGLAGIVVQADGVMLLERDEMIARANRHGLFIWARPIDG